jgi:hypothetical protein
MFVWKVCRFRDNKTWNINVVFYALVREVQLCVCVRVCVCE